VDWLAQDANRNEEVERYSPTRQNRDRKTTFNMLDDGKPIEQ